MMGSLIPVFGKMNLAAESRGHLSFKPARVTDLPRVLALSGDCMS